jgi:uncharacterized protein (TIGR02231 family)
MEMRAWVISSVLLLAFPTAAALAAETVDAESRIDAVTVYPDRAEITRIVQVSLPRGKSTVAVTGLPANLIPDSVRVRAGADLRIGSVETRKVFAETLVQDEERRLNGEIEALQDRRRGLDDRIAALQVQLDFIAAIGKQAPQTATEQMIRGKLDPAAWQEAWSRLGGGAAEAFGGMRKARLEQREIDRKVEQLNRALGQIRTGQKASMTARVNLELDRAAALSLELSYQLGGASWRPLYDARLASAEARIGLTQIGEVRQRTGEDWSGVKLTLSTARPAVSARMPDLNSWFIDFGPGLYRGKQKRSEFRSLEKSEAELFDEAQPKADGEPAPTGPPAPVAQVVAGEFASEYRIAGAANVPSDDAPHKFVIAEQSMDAELAVRVVPKLAAQGYLYAEVEYGGAQPLLPGPLSVFRDGAFIGTSHLALLRPGEKQKLSFGIDDKVRVEYRLVEGERSRQGLINRDRRQERRYLTKVTNHLERAMAITVLDNLPVPRDESIEVALLKDTTPPSEWDLDERKGVLAWAAEQQPGATREIRFGYAVTYPEDQQVPGF